MASEEDVKEKLIVDLNKKPAKGILKNSSSFETTEPIKRYICVYFSILFYAINKYPIFNNYIFINSA